MSVVSFLTSIVAWGYGGVNKIGKKIKDNRGLYFISNGFIIAKVNKIRLSWAISNYHRLGMEAGAEREPGARPERLISSLIASAPQAGGSRPH